MTSGTRDACGLNDDNSESFFSFYQQVYGSDSSYEEFERLWGDRLNRWADGSKADFAHQCVTVSASLATGLKRANPLLDPLFSGGSEEREDCAGRLGDASMIQALGEKRKYQHTSMDAGDYRADLDADNILHLMTDGGLSYQGAAERYYAALERGEYARAEAFLRNRGGYEAVVDKVFDNLKNPDLATSAQASYRKASDVPQGSELSLADKDAYIASDRELADTNAFLQALKEGRNDI